MPGHFRCGDTTNRCELARTGQIVCAKDLKCPLAREHCHREPVSWFAAMWHLHRKAIIASIVLLAGLLILLLVVRLMRPDAMGKELAALKEKSGTLDGRLRTMEAKPSDSGENGDPLDLLRTLTTRAKDLEGKIRTNVLGGRIAEARTDLQTLEGLHKQAVATAQSARNPAPASGTRALEAQQLITELQEVEGVADSLGARTREARRTDLTTGCEAIIEETRDAMKRARRIVPRRTAPPSAEVLDKPPGEIGTLLAKAKTVVASYAPPPEVPFQEKDATLAITAAADLGANLVIPMLKSRSGGEAVQVQGTWYYTSKLGVMPEEKVIVRPTSASPYSELTAKHADLVMADTLPTAEEAQAFTQQYQGKQLSSRSHSEVVALDALVLLANPDSKESVLTAAQAAQTSWISGPGGSPEHAVATRFGFQIAQTENRSPDAVVVENPSAHALGLYHKLGVNLPVKRLAYQPGPNTAALKPSPFTIGTENYRFTFRITASRSPESRPGALELVNFMTNQDGQAIVAKQGYVDLSLRTSSDVDPRILAVLSSAIGKDARGAVQMSTNFRFPFAEDKLDNKAIADLERLPVVITQQFRTPRVVILGYTDDRGTLTVNTRLSIARAKFIATELEKSIKGVKTAGMADQLPVDTNETDEGRNRNRRAEVWIVPD